RGFDRDAEAVEAARANVRAARLEREVTVSEADATRPLPIEDLQSGLLVTNPPYGDRLGQGGQKGVKAFYFPLRARPGALPGIRLAVLAGNPAFEAAFHHRPLRRRPLWNGPIACTLLEYAPPGLRRLGARLAATEEPSDVPPVGPEHRGEEDAGERR